VLTADWVTAIATVGTFLVILASAIAALAQLRHMRGSNQIIALTECRETLESDGFRQAQQFVSYELPKRLRDPNEARKIAEIPFVGDYQAIATVANFFESMGAFVKNRIIDRDIACDLWSGVVLRNWAALAPVIAYVRVEAGDDVWENFELLAALSARHQRKAGTDYPAGFERMPKDMTLVELLKQ